MKKILNSHNVIGVGHGQHKNAALLEVARRVLDHSQGLAEGLEAVVEGELARHQLHLQRGVRQQRLEAHLGMGTKWL